MIYLIWIFLYATHPYFETSTTSRENWNLRQSAKITIYSHRSIYRRIRLIFLYPVKTYRPPQPTIKEPAPYFNFKNSSSYRCSPQRWVSRISRINPNELPGTQNLIKKPIFTESYFNELCDQFRSPHIWKFEDNKWKLRNPVK